MYIAINVFTANALTQLVIAALDDYYLPYLAVSQIRYPSHLRILCVDVKTFWITLLAN